MARSVDLDDYGELAKSPVEVWPKLFVGNEEDAGVWISVGSSVAGDAGFLSSQSIRAVLNCTEDGPKTEAQRVHMVEKWPRNSTNAWAAQLHDCCKFASRHRVVARGNE